MQRYEIFVTKSHARYGENIYIVLVSGMGVGCEIRLGRPGKDGVLKFDEICPQGEQFPSPTLHVPFDMGKDFWESMAKHMNESGVSTETEEKLAGKLEATETHLKDMRDLLFHQMKVKSK